MDSLKWFSLSRLKSSPAASPYWLSIFLKLASTSSSWIKQKWCHFEAYYQTPSEHLDWRSASTCMTGGRDARRTHSTMEGVHSPGSGIVHARVPWPSATTLPGSPERSLPTRAVAAVTPLVFWTLKHAMSSYALHIILVLVKTLICIH